MIKKKYVFAPYSNLFPSLYELEKSRIQHHLALPIIIEHIGSTAVPGLGGKGIIDIAIAIDQQDIELAVQQLQQLGYILKAGLPQFSAPNRYFLTVDLSDPEETTRRYHIHLMEPSNPEWRRFLAFRNYLRDHPDVSEEYAILKQQAASEANESGERYRALKESIFHRLSD